MAKILARLKFVMGYRSIDAFPGGGLVQIRRSIRSPLAGNRGIIQDVSPNDLRGNYLVQFSNGLRFRYRASELEPVVRDKD